MSLPFASLTVTSNRRILPRSLAKLMNAVICHVYMLSSRPYGTLYLGITRDLGRRMVEHRNAVHPGFSADYGVYRLVWMEDYVRIVDAIAREKELKKWWREWKIALIEKNNPNWDDLFDRLNC